MGEFKRAIVETGFVYGLIGWVYVVVVSITHPKWIYNPLTYWFPLRLDYFGEICFIVSLVSFFLLRLKYKKL